VPLLSPFLESHNTRVEKDRTIPQLGRPDERRIVGLGSTAACDFVDLAADIRPVRLRVTVPIQNGEHEMDEPDIASLRLNHKTSDQMPTGMSIMAFPAFANLDRGFDLQPDRLARFLC